MKEKITVSIIVVHYKTKKLLFGCIKSILISKPKVNYEIIVVDNDEEKTIEKELKDNFPKVKYIKPPKNLGYGAGNNLGVKNAKGEYIFVLNPDTEVFKDTIEELINFFDTNKNIGIVAPLLLDKNNKPYPLQGTKELTPLRGIFALSFLNKLFPNNFISKKYWLLNWDKSKSQEVDVVPGTAFMIKKDFFKKN